MPRARIAAALTAGLALVLGACATPEPPPPRGAAAVPPDLRPDAAPVLTRVLGRISESGGVHSTVAGDLGLFGMLNAEGVVDYQQQHANLALKGQTRPRNQPRQQVEVTVVDGVGYLNSPLTRPEPAKPWIRIVPGNPDFAAKLLAPALTQLQEALDPRATFAGVERTTKIQSSTPEQIDGRPTTRYELRVLEHDGEQGYQLWVDDTGLPVRFAATQDVVQAGAVSLTSTYRDWGAPTEVQPPPEPLIGALPEGPPPQAQPPR